MRQNAIKETIAINIKIIRSRQTITFTAAESEVSLTEKDTHIILIAINKLRIRCITFHTSKKKTSKQFWIL